MTDSYRAELLDQTHQVFTAEMGGRAIIRDLVDALIADLPEGASDYYVRRGVTQVVQSYFRTKNTEGLPQAPQVNDAGEHVQLELLTVDDYRYLVRQYLDRAEANHAQAEKFAARCEAIWGVTLDVAEAKSA